MSAEENREPREQLRERLDYKYREVVEESGIAPEVALERGYRLEKTKAALGREGFTARFQQRVPAILIPRFSPLGERITPVIKPDNPRELNSKPGKPRVVKYETVSDSEIRLSVHPRVREKLRDIRHPLWITEGEKKGDALVSRKGVAVVVQGTGCWDVPQDWEDVKLHGREVIIAYDADVMVNPNVMGELVKLAEFLKSRGATVKYLKWPSKYRDTKMGVDDVLGPGEATLKEIYGWAEDAPDENAAPVGVTLSDVEIERVEWLWERRLPRGKVTVLDGDPGVGKSLILTGIAAAVSAGNPMPDGQEVERAGAVLVCAEDDAADTILPRFLAAGGDPTRARVIGAEETFIIPDHLDKLERAINQVGAAFVAIDPVMSFLSGELNSNNDQHVRSALQPLVNVAKRTGAAIVICRHMTKSSGGGQPIYRGQGSIGVIGIARSGLMVGKHPEMDETYLLAGQKSNLSRPPETLAYSIVATPPEFEVPRIQWLGESEVSAQEMSATPEDEGERDRLTEAKEFLRDVLRAGPVSTKQVKRESSGADISWRTVERAKSTLKVQAYRDGEGGRWMWVMDSPSGEHVSVSNPVGGDGGDGGLEPVSHSANVGGDGGLPFTTTITTNNNNDRYRENGQGRQDRQDRQPDSDNSHADKSPEDRQDRQVIQLRQAEVPSDELEPRERLQRKNAERQRLRSESGLEETP